MPPLPKRTFWQWAAFILAIAIVLLCITMLWSQLRGIIQSELDIFLGAAFGGATALASYAIRDNTAELELERIKDKIRDGDSPEIDQTVVRRAQEMILEGDPRFKDVIKKQVDLAITDKGYRPVAALLGRNIDAAMKRLSEYFDGQAVDHEIHTKLDTLMIIMSDLDQAKANSNDLHAELGLGTIAPDPIILRYRSILTTLYRDISEAFNRRNDTYRAIRETEILWPSIQNIFSVMTADIAKAKVTTFEIMSESQRNSDFLVHIRSVLQYLAAAQARARVIIQRANEIKDTHYDDFVPLPDTFDVMMSDLNTASHQLLELLREQQDDTESLGLLEQELMHSAAGSVDPEVDARRASSRPILRNLNEASRRLDEASVVIRDNVKVFGSILDLWRIVETDLTTAKHMHRTALKDVPHPAEFLTDMLTVREYLAAVINRLHEIERALDQSEHTGWRHIAPHSYFVLRSDITAAFRRVEELLSSESDKFDGAYKVMLDPVNTEWSDNA